MSYSAQEQMVLQALMQKRLQSVISQVEKQILHSLLYGGQLPPDYTTPPPKASTTAMDQSPPKELPKQDLLVKMLKMTTSDNDNQALVAMRKANALLEAAGWTWEKLIAGKIVVVGDPFASTPIPTSYGRGQYANPSPPMRPPAPIKSQPTPPPRPAPPPVRYYDLNGTGWHSQALADASDRKILASRKPKGVVNSQLQNRFPGNCWCCGDWLDAGKGWLFKPIDFNGHASSTARKAICTTCNDSTTLSVPPKPAKGNSAILSDLI